MAKIHNNDRYTNGSCEDRLAPKLVPGSAYGRFGQYSVNADKGAQIGLNKAREIRKMAGMSKKAEAGKYD